MKVPLTRGIKTNINAQFNDSLMENMITNPDPVLNSGGYISNHFGLSEISPIRSGGSSRGAAYNDRFNVGFRVIGNQLVVTDKNGKYLSALGRVEGEGQVAMPFSFNTQAIITQQGNFYLYDSDEGFREVDDENLGAVFDATWIDGYYFMVDSESPIVTDILAEDSIRQLNYGSAEIEPDPIRGCSKWRNFAVVFGSSTAEFYENTAAVNFPFTRVESYTVYIGIVGTHAKAKLPDEQGFIVLGGSRNETTSFYFISGGQTQNISNKEIDRIVTRYSEEALKDVKLEYLKKEDQEFIYAHLPEHTLLYDMTTSQKMGYYQWSVIKTGWSQQADFKGYWQGINVIKAPGINSYTFGNRNNSKIAKIDDETCNQFGEQQEHIIYSPLVMIGEPISINSVQPQTLNGNNNINRQEDLFLSLTEDGRSFTKEVALDIGERGRRWDQVIFRRLGFFKNWFGVKFRYIGKTNITLAELEVD